MWHTVNVRHPARFDHRRTHQVVRHRHKGFSHPARFEELEQRLALNVAPAAPAAIPSLPQFVANGTSGGTTGSLVGANPGNFSPANATGSVAAAQGNVLDSQQVAFNSPYWLPNDRVPLAAPPSDQLPANANQAASTPQGVRSFSFGPDTGTHFSSPSMTLTVRRPIIMDTDRQWVAQSALDDVLLGEALLPGETNDAALLDRHSEFGDAPTANRPPISDSPHEQPAPASEPLHLETAIVDRMMAETDPGDTVGADAAILPVASANLAETEPDPGSVAYALAVSLAAGVVKPGEHRSQSPCATVSTRMPRSKQP